MNKDFKNLYDNCVRISTKKVNEMLLIEKKKNNLQKNRLYNNIIRSINMNDIRDSAILGRKYHIIYEGHYNKLIEDILFSLRKYFNPFKVLYKKKNMCQKTFIQNLSQENTYLLYLSWCNFQEDKEKDIEDNKEINKIKDKVENKAENKDVIKNEKIEEEKLTNDVYSENNNLNNKEYNDNDKLTEDYFINFEEEILSD